MASASTTLPRIACWIVASLGGLGATSVASAQASAGDLNGDGRVDGFDLSIMLANWGPCAPSIFPEQGSPAGGTLITIRGQGLDGATSVTIGGVPCTQVVAVCATQVMAVTPAGPAGAAAVVVDGPGGSVTVPAGFTYGPDAPVWATVVDAEPDPSVVTNPVLRGAIAATGLAWRVRDRATQVEMVLIPPGTFQMSAPSTLACGVFPGWGEHSVTIQRPLYMGRHEVTQAQWQAKLGCNPSYFQGRSDSDTRPVERVSWLAVQQYLALTGFRLPTEAQWEYACRAGSPPPFYGESADCGALGALAWYAENSGGESHAVGGRQPNGFGLFDMLGNVSEWVDDRFNFGGFPPEPRFDPPGPPAGLESVTFRVFRGGSAWDGRFRANSTYREGAPPGGAISAIGFRVIRDP